MADSPGKTDRVTGEIATVSGRRMVTRELDKVVSILNGRKF
jgi:hypothetical protein